MKTAFRYTLLVAACAMAVAVFALGSRNAREKNSGSVPATTQGITGTVEIWEGNFMPMIDPARRTGQITPGAGRRVRVHQPVRAEGGLATAKHATVPTPLVAEAVCDSAGRFVIPVNPGLYSIFVEEDGGWYYNGWNSDGIQGAVTVEPGKNTNITIQVTTKAVF